ncbi:MAG: hypothetical protein ACKO27_07145 [Ilumatobacteraceae bacterium]
MNPVDRRRAFFATIFTVVAVLVLIVSGGDDEPTVAQGAGLNGSPTAPPTTRYEPDAPVFVAGDGDVDAAAPGQVLVPPPPSGNIVIGRASHGRYDDDLSRPCTTGVAPDQATLQVTNLNNGQTTLCVNTYGKTPPTGVEIVLDSDQFSEIARLTDAPIPVRINW